MLRKSCASLIFVMSLSAMQVHADATTDVLRSYYAYDALPLELEIKSAETRSSIKRFELSFSAFDNERVTARLEVPDGVERPPVVILLHGITQSLDQWWREDGGAYSFPSAHRAALVDAGFAVLAMDARNHGSRIIGADFENATAYLDSGYFEAVRKMISQSVIDVRRLLDVVEALDEVNGEKIGLAGFSLGASIGYIAAAIDERVDSSVLIGFPFLEGDDMEGNGYTSPFHYAPALQDRQILFISGKTDHFSSLEGMANLEGRLGQNAKVRWMESGHDFPVETAKYTLQFFDEYLD